MDTIMGCDFCDRPATTEECGAEGMTRYLCDQCAKAFRRGREFEKACEHIRGPPGPKIIMKFGDVLEEMVDDPGKRFARRGWNGRNQYIYYTPGRILDSKEWDGSDDLTGDEEEYKRVIIRPHIDMLASDGTRVIGWLASQTDMLSDDWYEVR